MCRRWKQRTIEQHTCRKSYSIEVKQGTTLLYRDKVYCTSKTDTTISHTLNTSEYNNYDSDAAGQQYIII